MTRAKYRRLERQARVPLGKYFVITLLAVIFVNFLAYVHAGIVVANILLASAFCFVYFKRAVPVRFRKSVSAVYLVLITVFNLPSILLTLLLAFSFALCFAGKLDWNELAATL